MAVAATSEAATSLQCAICGDEASAFNFGVLSCESCKAFFRRATRSSKVPLCVFSGDCVVSLRTRRFCSACRLRKCQTVGMNKCLVLSEEQRKQRQVIIDNNRRLRNGSTHAGRLQPGPSAPPVVRLPLPLVGSVIATGASQRQQQQPQQQQLDDDVDAGWSEPSERWAHCDIVPAATATAAGVTAVLPSSCMYNSAPELDLPSLEGAISAKFSVDVTCDMSLSASSPQQPAALYPEECTLFSETMAFLGQLPTSQPALPEQQQQHHLFSLRAATLPSLSRRQLTSQTCDALEVVTRLYKSKIVASPRTVLPKMAAIDETEMTDQLCSPNVERENRLQQFTVRLSDLVSDYVLFVRELPDVSRFKLNAQMALVKACAPAFILLRAAELYDEGRAAWVDEQGVIVSAAVVDDLVSDISCEPGVKSSTELSGRSRRFLKMLSDVRRQLPAHALCGSIDQTAIALLQIIASLSPELMPSDIISQNSLDALANAQRSYGYLLRQHLEATSSFEGATNLWPKLLSTLEMFKRTARCMKDLLLSCAAVRGDELLEEILG